MRKSADMSASDRVTLRVTPDITTRADALRAALAKDAALLGFTRTTRAIVLKRALLEGLALLEKRYAKKPGP